MWTLLLIICLLQLIVASVFILVSRWIDNNRHTESSCGEAHGRTYRYSQFRLKTLLLFFMLFGVVCATGRILYLNVRHQSQVITLIRSFGGIILYDFQYDFPAILRSKPDWKPASPPSDIVRVLGDDLWANVVYVQFNENPITDEILDLLVVNIEGLADLHHLRIMRSELTRKSLENLGKLQQLRLLEINGEGLSEADIDTIQHLLPDCEVIIKDGNATVATNGFPLAEPKHFVFENSDTKR